MKHLLFVFLYLATQIGVGQVLFDTVPSHWTVVREYTLTTSYYGRQIFRNDTVVKCDKIYVSNESQGISAWISCDSVVGISGDDKKIIRMLLEELMKSFEREQKTQKEFEKFIETSVAFSNHVPDYFRSKDGNCKWPQYNTLLNKYGWKVYKTKPKPHTCKSK